MSTATVDIPGDVKDALKRFRFKKSTSNSAISGLNVSDWIVKIVKAKLVMQIDEELDDMSIEEIAEELPENSPRYVVVSYELKHPDGRVSNPLILINWAPSSSPTDLMTLHASMLSNFQQVVEVAKVLEVRDGAEGLTTKAVNDRLLQN